MRLVELAKAFELANEMFRTFYDREKDDLAFVNDETFTLAEFLGEADLAGFEEPEREAVLTVWAIQDNPDRFVVLPANRDQQMGDLMRQFAFNQDDKACDAILEEIRGRENSGRFDRVIERFALHHEWQDFKDEGWRRVASMWCEENGIAYEE